MRLPVLNCDGRANSRTNIPQVNLKDRIAALQQRNASLSQPGSDIGTPSIPGRIAMTGASSLKDKIANFERKGAVPVPRGRFGESAPATNDSLLNKRGELYGNRVPELAKSTGEAALLVRKRTVSSHTARSYSISKPLTPMLTGDAPPLPPLPPLQPQRTGDWAGFSEARFPSNFDKVERRVASDALPRTSPILDIEVEGPLTETQDEGKVIGKEEVQSVGDRQDESAKKSQIILESTFASPTDPTTTQQAEHSTYVSGPGLDKVPRKVLLDAGTPAKSAQDGPLTLETGVNPEVTTVVSTPEQVPPPVIEVVEHDLTPTPSSDALQGLIESSTVQTIAFPLVPAHGLSSANVPADDTSPPPSAPLSLNTESGSSGSEEVSISSEELHTPSDTSFQTAEFPANAKIADAVPVVVVQDVVVAELPSTLSPAVKTESPISRPSDLPDTPQTAKPKLAALVSPTQSVVIPATTPSSPSEKAVLEYKAGQKSFHAVVHRKIVEASPVEPVPTTPVTRPAQKRTNPSFPPQKSTVQRVISQAYVEPESPSMGDLAALVADAAMLEEVLADPAKKPARRTKPTLPEIRESRSLERSRPAEIRIEGVHGNTIFPPEDSPYSDHKTAANSSSFFTSNLRTAPTTTRKSTSTSPSRASQGPKSFSSLRVRKQSMPGAYPRTSVCSEMSTDESTMVSTSSSPPVYSRDGSDTSSIRSSSKSWKSSKKGIGRASSWLFRKKEERPLPPLPEPTSPIPSTTLSPNMAVGSRRGDSPLPPRPESWLSVSSAGSGGGDVFSSEFFDAFPSVPGSLPAPSHSQTLPSGHKTASGLTRPHTISGPPSRR
ncbi:hypothetical protein BDY19DRAFT_902507 [Irpex rosettiformis]|uniref:Uncharacterized protein n=1 Tax=Irpex rosettiformis TaxID=378272 RepID=A0ACB8UHK9_9APHY|nr:hypothetical protein BDY19DRAFT_902507 [Irpex rosettiformis]